MVIRASRLLTIAVAAALVGSLSTGAAGAAEPGKPKMQTARLAVDISGFIEVQEMHDTTTDCFPGIRYKQTTHVSFETGRPAAVKLVNVSLPGTDGVLTSTFSPPVGTVTVAGSLSDQHTTNYCSGPTEKLPPFPACNSNSGKVSISLQKAGSDEDGDLVGLNGKWLNLAIQRVGGGMQDPTCVGRGPDNLTGEQTAQAVINSSMAPGVFMAVPTGLGSLPLFLAKKGKKFTRAVVFSGPCSSVNVAVSSGSGSAAPAAVVNADGDCFLTGKVVMTVRKK